MEPCQKLLLHYLQQGKIEDVLYIIREFSPLSIGAKELIELDKSGFTLTIRSKTEGVKLDEKPIPSEPTCIEPIKPVLTFSDIQDYPSSPALFYDIIASGKYYDTGLQRYLKMNPARVRPIFLHAITKDDVNVIATLISGYGTLLNKADTEFSAIALKSGSLKACRFLHTSGYSFNGIETKWVNFSVMGIFSWLVTTFPIYLVPILFQALEMNQRAIIDEFLECKLDHSFQSEHDGYKLLDLAIRKDNGKMIEYCIDKLRSSYGEAVSMIQAFNTCIKYKNDKTVLLLYEKGYRFAPVNYINLLSDPNPNITEVLVSSN